MRKNTECADFIYVRLAYSYLPTVKQKKHFPLTSFLDALATRSIP